MKTLEKNEDIILEDTLKKRYKNINITPIFTTFVFELKKQWKKFIFFAGFSILCVLIGGPIPYYIVPDLAIQSERLFFQYNIRAYIAVIDLMACLFFGGIICEEFSNKTGNIVFPIINKYKVITGKYLASLIMILGVVGIYYLALGLTRVYFFNRLIHIKYFYSFGFALLYTIAVSSFVTMFSSFMKGVNLTIVLTILLLLVAFLLIDSLFILGLPEYEPVYSLDHMSKLIHYILEHDFPKTIEDRYADGGGYQQGPISHLLSRSWKTPSIEGGIIIALSYIIICNTIAFLIFSRRQL
ncbi:MAG: ABC transporter permease [Promethearchaeota archaeon]